MFIFPVKLQLSIALTQITYPKPQSNMHLTVREENNDNMNKNKKCTEMRNFTAFYVFVCFCTRSFNKYFQFFPEVFMMFLQDVL